MATSFHNNQTHIYPDNPVIQPKSDFSATYPPIKHDGRWLRNKYTGEIVPNVPDYAERSDILEAISDDEAEAIFAKTVKAVKRDTSTAKGMKAL